MDDELRLITGYLYSYIEEIFGTINVIELIEYESLWSREIEEANEACNEQNG